MNMIIISLAVTFITALIASIVLFPVIIKWSPRLGLVDVPNLRKVHTTPIPAIGGLVIFLSLITALLISAPLRQLAGNHISISVSLLVLTITGVIDDRLNILPRVRFILQLICALCIAADGTRIYTLHGLFGIFDLPVILQYLLTMLIIVGVTNAFNLIDGINGLAGSMAMVNTLVLSVMCCLAYATNWLYLLLPLIAALAVFLKYNYRSAKVFLGDGGSLSIGFLISAVGISLIQSVGDSSPQNSSLFIVLITACSIIPVVDTLRVFYSRIKKGRSPFSADKNHLHHWLIRHHLTHSQATGKLIQLHILLIFISAAALSFMSITSVIVLQAAVVSGYTKLIQLSAYFHKWYRFIKKAEAVK